MQLSFIEVYMKIARSLQLISSSSNTKKRSRSHWPSANILLIIANSSLAIYLIIPGDRVGYEVINNQRARSASWLRSFHIQQGRME